MNYFFFRFFHNSHMALPKKTKQTETNHTDGPQSAEVETVST